MKSCLSLMLTTLLWSICLAQAESQTLPVSHDEASTTVIVSTMPSNPGRRDILSDQVLSNSGPLVTSIGTGFGGADESVLQLNTLGMTTLGTRTSTPDFRVAEDARFSTDVLIERITLFAYQVNSGITSTMTEVNLRVWDGIPGEPGSQIVFGDTFTNQLVSTEFSGVYRVFDLTIGNDARPIMTVVVEPNLYLEHGTYWFDWQLDGSGNNGPWTPHVTILGNEKTGNAMLSNDNGTTWFPLLDNAIATNQGAPLIIEGNRILSVPSGTQLSWLLLIIITSLIAGRQLNRSKHTASD